MKYSAVVFDLDGTLLDTLDDLADSGNEALRRNGFATHSVDAYRDFVGDGVNALVRQMLPEEHRDQATCDTVKLAYREAYTERWKAKTKPYDGIAGLLDSLRAEGIKMGILSNKPHHFTQMCVAELLSPWTFDPVLGHREEAARKPDPGGALEMAEGWGLRPSQVAFLGDTSTDMETAQAAGMCFVGALWGFRPTELRQSGIKNLIRYPAELFDFLTAPR